MNKKNEFIIYSTLILLFGLVIIDTDVKSNFYLYYSISLWLSSGIMLWLSRYVVAPKMVNGRFTIPLTVLTFGFLVSFSVTGYLYARYLVDNSTIADVTLLDPFVIEACIAYHLIFALSGFIYLIDFKKKVFRKTFYYLLIIAIIFVVGFFVKYFVDTSYDGDDSIKFLNSNYTTLSDIITLEQFKDKPIYIDMWYSSCSPCIKEFKRLPTLKKALKNGNVVYLYLARETSHPSSLQLWKNAIRKYNLEGWHVYMSKELEENVWELIEENTENSQRAYPHYLLVNKANRIVSYSAKKPSEGEILINEITGLIVE